MLPPRYIANYTATFMAVTPVANPTCTVTFTSAPGSAASSYGGALQTLYYQGAPGNCLADSCATAGHILVTDAYGGCVCVCVRV